MFFSTSALPNSYSCPTCTRTHRPHNSQGPSRDHCHQTYARYLGLQRSHLNGRSQLCNPSRKCQLCALRKRRRHRLFSACSRSPSWDMSSSSHASSSKFMDTSGSISCCSSWCSPRSSIQLVSSATCGANAALPSTVCKPSLCISSSNSAAAKTSSSYRQGSGCPSPWRGSPFVAARRLGSRGPGFRDVEYDPGPIVVRPLWPRMHPRTNHTWCHPVVADHRPSTRILRRL